MTEQDRARQAIKRHCTNPDCEIDKVYDLLARYPDMKVLTTTNAESDLKMSPETLIRLVEKRSQQHSINAVWEGTEQLGPNPFIFIFQSPEVPEGMIQATLHSVAEPQTVQ